VRGESREIESEKQEGRERDQEREERAREQGVRVKERGARRREQKNGRNERLRVYILAMGGPKYGELLEGEVQRRYSAKYKGSTLEVQKKDEVLA